MVIHSIAGLIWKLQYKDKSVFSWDVWTFWWDCKSWIGSIYIMNANPKVAGVIDTATLASKTDLADLKSKEDNFDVDKLDTVFADWSYLNNVVDMLSKRIVYNNWLPKSMLLILRYQILVD